MKVKILIDSASDINAEEAKTMGVELIPIEIRFGDEEYLDGVTMLPTQFYDKLIKSEQLPTTSQINSYTFEEKFDELVGKGYEVVAIILSSRLSGTYCNAVTASKKFNGKVFVVDSLNASIVERLLCQHALKLAGEGASAKEIAQELDEVKRKINFIALLDTLHYLKKGGRISAITAFAGQMLSIKPVVSVIDGEVRLIGKAIGSKKGNNLLKTLVKQKGVDFSMPYGTIYSGNDDSKLSNYIKDSEDIWKENAKSLPVYALGCTIGTHIGPGSIGVAFFEK